MGNDTEMNDNDRIKVMQKRLGYDFKNTELLLTALTHSSFANENKKLGAGSNERLEFLGDSVLGMTVADLIYSGLPNMPEGRMTRLRAELVCEKSLASVAGKLDIGGYLRLGRGEEKCGGRERPSILADAVEAVIAAMYLDGGTEPVARFVSEFIGTVSDFKEFANTDYKTALQEIIQEKQGRVLKYMVTGESGPDHLKSYTVEVSVNGKAIGRGTGKSKKEAEQSAACAALSEVSG